VKNTYTSCNEQLIIEEKSGMLKRLFLFIIISFASALLFGEDSSIQNKLASLGFQTPKTESMSRDFTVEDMNGKKVKLSDFKGNVVLLNQWATWCPPCKKEMPSIQRLFEKMKGKSFTVMAVSVGEKKETVAGFLKSNKYSFPIFLDPTGNATADYGTGSIPTTYLIDKNGKILGRIVGGIEWDNPKIVSLINELLK
jgi:peroxiredoxin